ncbi:MAG: hypothetical protein U0793_33140 [Gemmataceae bacterium]
MTRRRDLLDLIVARIQLLSGIEDSDARIEQNRSDDREIWESGN